MQDRVIESARQAIRFPQMQCHLRTEPPLKLASCPHPRPHLNQLLWWDVRSQALAQHRMLAEGKQCFVHCHRLCTCPRVCERKCVCVCVCVRACVCLCLCVCLEHDGVCLR